MKDFQINIPVKALEYSELDEPTRQLVDAAKSATHRAYAPYSHFRVGAAIALDNGEIISGSNQENAAFPSGTCAERTACYYAHAAHPEAVFRGIAIAAIGTDGHPVAEPISPCGACRQALLEYETLAGKDVPVYLVGADKIYQLPSVKSLLPFAFAEF